MKTLTSLLIFLLLIPFIAYSQTFEQYKKQERQKLELFRKTQNTGMAQLAKSYNEYVQKADKEFANYLDKEWKSYQAFAGIKMPSQPKPSIIPHFKPLIGDSGLTKKIPTPSIILPVNKLITQKPVQPIIQKTDHNNFHKSNIQVNFFGTDLSFPFDAGMQEVISGTIDPHSISQWWTQVSKTNYNVLVNKLFDTKSALSLNDWAYLLLVEKTAGEITHDDINRKALLTWFLMIRSGYDIKLAFYDNRIYVLFPSPNLVYGKAFLQMNNQPYYVLENTNNKSYQAYSFDFPGATKSIDFSIRQPLNIGKKVSKKQFDFSYGGKNYSFKISLNLDNLDFMKNYPETDLSVFFNAAMSRVTKESIAEDLMPVVSNMDTNQALNFLLRLVQKSFKYETDQEQFGREKFFFPEEVFFYPGSDCEDRAGLYTYLVENLLHLKVVGLVYKGHVATAVDDGDKPHGDYLVYKNITYTIADPTYINAPLGLTMPQYRNSRPQILETLSTNYLASNLDDFWKTANTAGEYRGSNLTDAVIAHSGNCYLTGYRIQKPAHGNQDDGNRQAFIAKYNKNRKLLWLRPLETKGVSTGFAITLDNNGNPAIAGSFQGEITGNNESLNTKKDGTDVFAAQYDSSGRMLWIQKSDLDTMHKAQYLNYVIHFNSTGKRLGTNLFLENELRPSSGIFYNNHILSIIGEINNTTGMEKMSGSLNSTENFNVIDYLKTENDAMIANNINKSVAGLFAALNLMMHSGMILEGKDVQKALNKYNPAFRTSSPSIFENIGEVEFVKNDDGIISMKTFDRKVSFDEIRINNGAKIKVVPLKNGNEEIDVLSGIKVGKLFVWYDLNFIQIHPKSGNLLFDYDSDHTQATINMQKDILD
ncbi:MAG: hypothetical protein IH595_04280 [Bacteroidales bacterium]|nr:hypothetical protein [Bacteroidales bacterium]